MAEKVKFVSHERSSHSKNKLDNWRVDSSKRDKCLPPYKELRCISVSFVASDQVWCEKNLDYQLRSEPKRVESMDKAAVKGHELHIQKMLELGKNLEAMTYEAGDRATQLKPIQQYACWVRSMTSCFEELASGGKVGNITIFGCLPNIQRVIVGNVDELEFAKEDQILYLREFKSRVRRCLPTGGLMKTHHMQTQIYRYLFNQLIDNSLDIKTICGHWEVNPWEELEESKTCLADLLRELLTKAKVLPKISVIEIEYAHQADGHVFDKVHVPMDDVRLLRKIEGFSKYWSGEREPVGVDIEEARKKCPNCKFFGTCNWRYKNASGTRAGRFNYY